MIDHGVVKSTIAPAPVVLDEFSVWVNSNIQPVTETVGDETFEGFQYSMVQYGKDEYIKAIADKNSGLEIQVTDLQVALVELFEGMV